MLAFDALKYMRVVGLYEDSILVLLIFKVIQKFYDYLGFLLGINKFGLIF